MRMRESNFLRAAIVLFWGLFIHRRHSVLFSSNDLNYIQSKLKQFLEILYVMVFKDGASVILTNKVIDQISLGL